MKRPSWGFGIALLYTVFAVSILGLVWQSFGQKIELVTDNYYEKELEFDAQIAKSNRAKALPEPLMWSISNDSLRLRFPGLATGGKLTFLRPSDAAADTVIAVSQNVGSEIAVALSAFRKGAYRLKADWTMADGGYYSEHIVVIP